MRTASLGLTLLAGLVILGSAFSAIDQEPESATLPERSFTITSDPTEPVVSMRSSSSLSGSRSSSTLYGDGRYVRETYAWSGELGHFETTLPFEELQQLAALAVDHGLIDTDDRQIDERRKALLRQDLEPFRARVSTSDQAQIVLTIHLASYTRDGKTREQVTKMFRLKSPIAFERLFPEIPEYAGLAKLLRRLNSIAVQAEQQDGKNNP